MATDVNLEKMAQDIGGTTRPVVRPDFYNSLSSLNTPAPPDVGPMAAKHRELVDAAGDIPNRTMIAFRDAARRTASVAEWDRFEAALYALIGDPE